MAEIGKVLSKKQKDQYTRLLGEPFHLAGPTDEKGRKLFDESADLASALLKMPAIREELKLTAEQTAALDRDEPASKVLKPAQRARLDQIELQAEGPSAFARPDVIRSLKLDDQSSRSRASSTASATPGASSARPEGGRRGPQGRGRPDPDPAVEKTRKDQEKARMRTVADQMGQGVMARIAAVLTRAQRDAFRKLLGEPFDFGKLRGPDAQAIANGAAPFVKEGSRP